MHSSLLEYVGNSLYKKNVLKERKRYFVFRLRCALHARYVNELMRFFGENSFRKELLQGTPAFLEQVTRSFFYKNSTWKERVNIVKTHVEILEQIFRQELLEELYTKKTGVCLWKDEYEGKDLSINLFFHAGQRKEGCLSLRLQYEDILPHGDLYQIMFWLGKDDKDNPAVYIGALQGTPNGSEIIKGLTKAFFGYRTKNLIFYALRSFAKFVGAKSIYAVGNEGYYAMNHMRSDRKLKTDFGAFWEECEGVRCEDKRFYIIPVEEHRKTMDELKPSKRAQHRRRFAKMDELEAAVADSLLRYKKQ